MTQANTVYGALHGLQVIFFCVFAYIGERLLWLFTIWYKTLQTFSQLCRFNIKTRKLEVHLVPWTIIDEPRFSYRGLLIGEMFLMLTVSESLEANLFIQSGSSERDLDRLAVSSTSDHWTWNGCTRRTRLATNLADPFSRCIGLTDVGSTARRIRQRSSFHSILKSIKSNDR